MVSVSNLLFSSLEKWSQSLGHPTSQYNHPEDRAIGKLSTELNGERIACVGCICYFFEIIDP